MRRNLGSRREEGTWAKERRHQGPASQATTTQKDMEEVGKVGHERNVKSPDEKHR